MLQKGNPPCLLGKFDEIKNGYRYTLGVGGDGKSFKALAVPGSPETNNNRRFYLDESGAIRVTTDGSEPNKNSTTVGE